MRYQLHMQTEPLPKTSWSPSCWYRTLRGWSAPDIPAQYVQEYENRLKNEEFKAAEIAKATGSEISLMTTTANNPLKPTVTYFRKSSCFMQFIWPVVCHT